MQPFTARLAPHFAANPKADRLYEVVTPDGERIASTTSELAAKMLASSLNSNVNAWAEHIGADAVVGG